MPLTSTPANVTQLNALQFLTAKSTRADFTVENTELQLQIEAPAPSVYRLRCAPAALFADDKPSQRAKAHAELLLARQEAVGEMAVSSMHEQELQGWRLEQGDLALELSHSPLQISLYKGDDCLLQTQPGNFLGVSASKEPVWQIAVPLHTESLYGLGETTGELDRLGERIVSDQPAGRALPLVWSPDGWGLYVNTLDRVEHDLGKAHPDLYTITAHGSLLDIFIFVGEPGEILNQYTALTGRAGQPGLWPMGVWLDQQAGQSTEETLRVAKRLREEGFAFDVVRLAHPAPFGFQADKPAFEWDSTRVQDVRSLLADFAEVGVQVVAPTFPGVLAGTPLFDEWEDRGWLLIDDDTADAYVFAGHAASGGKPFGLLDLTHKDVYKLWSERHRQLFDEGLGAAECDAQFDIPDGITARGGETGAILRTVYPVLARSALFDAVGGHKTPQEGVVFSRDLFPGAQRYAWQAGPTVPTSWDGLQASLRAALASGSSGICAQMHALDAAGSDQAVTPELYIRWLAMSVLSANFSLSSSPRLLPSAFNEETRALAQHWLEWRYRLIPYVLGIIEDAVRTGLPVQRSMAMSFPNDINAHVWDAQYLFGPALLVAPILHPGNETRVYLPEGDAWWDMRTGWRYEGGTTLTVTADLDALPVFGREGHMLCLGPVAQHTGEFNSARMLDEVWMFGMPEHSPVVMRNKIRVMQMQGSSYIKGLEGLRILPSEGLEVKRRGAEVRISRVR